LGKGGIVPFTVNKTMGTFASETPGCYTKPFYSYVPSWYKANFFLWAKP
jgi:hypothetical protein